MIKYTIKINYKHRMIAQHEVNVVMFDKYELIEWFSNFLEQQPNLKDKINNFEVIECHD